jgi:hypothetical protein
MSSGRHRCCTRQGLRAVAAGGSGYRRATWDGEVLLSNSWAAQVTPSAPVPPTGSRRTRWAFGPASGLTLERLHSGRERAAVGLSRDAISSTDLGAFSDSRRRNFSRLTEMTRSVLRKLLRPSFHMAAGTAA